MPETMISPSYPIKAWAEDDRPREKLILKGRHVLSDAELLAILISTGTREESALDLGKKILHAVADDLNELGKLSVADLEKIKGIGRAKAVSIVASLELGRRRKEALVQEKPFIASSADAFRCFYPVVEDQKHETFWILLLNRNNKVIGRHRISEGGVHGTVVDPKIIFKFAIEALASSIVLCHNHPSGNIRPSEQDVQLTKKIRDAGKVLEIAVLDHIITGEKSYFSFSDEGLMN